MLAHRSRNLARILRVALLLLFLAAAFGACDDGFSRHEFLPDAATDGPAGSGSNAAGSWMASPPDVQLDFVVVVLGVVIMAGGLRRPRRRASSDQL